MVDISKNKQRMLQVYRILRSETDENHPISVPEIQARLDEEGYHSDRRAIYDDLKVLESFDVDIVFQRGKKTGYFLGTREFELPELKLLVDAVQSSKFISKNKTEKLIKKIEGFASRFDAGQLNRQVYIYDRVKTKNEVVFYTIDNLHRAINSNKKITFQYSEYSLEKKLVLKRDGALYRVSPRLLTWADENYYLIGLDESAGEIRNYRVDKIFNVTVLDEGSVSGREINASDYVKKVFGMFPGDESSVEVLFDNSLVGVVIDRFGKDVIINKYDDEYFVARLKVSVSGTFLSWVFQFGERAKILYPPQVKEKMKEMAEKVAKQYI